MQAYKRASIVRNLARRFRATYPTEAMATPAMSPSRRFRNAYGEQTHVIEPVPSGIIARPECESITAGAGHEEVMLDPTVCRTSVGFRINVISIPENI